MSACIAAMSGAGVLVAVCSIAAAVGSPECFHRENKKPPTRMPHVKSTRLCSTAVFVMATTLAQFSVSRNIDVILHFDRTTEPRDAPKTRAAAKTAYHADPARW